MPVAEGVVGAGHGVIGVLIVQKAEDFRNDSIAVGSDEACGASLDALGPFGRLLSLDWKLQKLAPDKGIARRFITSKNMQLIAYFYLRFLSFML